MTLLYTSSLNRTDDASKNPVFKIDYYVGKNCRTEWKLGEECVEICIHLTDNIGFWMITPENYQPNGKKINQQQKQIEGHRNYCGEIVARWCCAHTERHHWTMFIYQCNCWMNGNILCVFKLNHNRLFRPTSSSSWRLNLNEAHFCLLLNDSLTFIIMCVEKCNSI